MTNEQYAQAVLDAEEKLLVFLQTFESIQENIRLERLGEFQDRLREAASDIVLRSSRRTGAARPAGVLEPVP